MSHVNRNDRLSRRLLGLIGRCEAVENQNRALAEKVAALEKDLTAAREESVTALREMDGRLSQAFDLIDGLAVRVAYVEQHPALALPSLTEPEIAQLTTDAPAPVTT